MAYPTGMLSFVLEHIDRRIADVKRNATNVRNEANSGDIPSSRILTLLVNLRQDRTSLVAAAATPGIGAYAQQIKNNPTLDVVAEFNSVIASLDQVVAWIVANFPQDGQGFLLAQTLGPAGPVDRMFTPAQTSGLRTQLDSLIITIE